MNTETFAKQYPIALAAIAEHITSHGLPAPLDILTVDELRGGGSMGHAIRLHLAGQHTHQPWLDTVEVDAVETEPMDSGLGGVRHQWTVRLPDTGIRLQLVGYQHTVFASMLGVSA